MVTVLNVDVVIAVGVVNPMNVAINQNVLDVLHGFQETAHTSAG